MGSRQNLPQWGMNATCSPLPMSSWNQPLDSSFCQVISSHHDSRWYICFPLTLFSQLRKKEPKAMFYYFNVRALSSGKDIIFLYVCLNCKISQMDTLSYWIESFFPHCKHWPFINADKYFKIISKIFVPHFCFCTNIATNCFQLKTVRFMSVDISNTRPYNYFQLLI